MVKDKWTRSQLHSFLMVNHHASPLLAVLSQPFRPNCRIMASEFEIVQHWWSETWWNKWLAFFSFYRFRTWLASDEILTNNPLLWSRCIWISPDTVHYRFCQDTDELNASFKGYLCGIWLLHFWVTMSIQRPSHSRINQSHNWIDLFSISNKLIWLPDVINAVCMTSCRKFLIVRAIFVIASITMAIRQGQLIGLYITR